MKKITLSLFAFVASCASMSSQVVLSEDFTSPFNVTAAGWGTLNLSTTIGGIPSWFQGVGANFPSYNGATNDYYAAHYNNGGGTNCDISNWLFTPMVTIENGSVLQFATRSAQLFFNPPSPDRMQVRFSTAGNNMVIPPGPANVGTFTNLMLDINPMYTTNTASAVTNGTMVNGYPDVWTVYTLTVTNVPVATTGRFAFRYYVEDGGPNGTRSTYVGIDAVRYIRPCLGTVASYTTCANFNTVLNATGGLGVTTYSWSTGATTQSIMVSPASTTVYTVTPINNGVPCANANITATITTAPQLGVNIVATPTNVCAGSSATLTAVTSGTNYLWTTGETTSVITITPSASGTYSLAASLGNPPNSVCGGGSIININVIPTPTIGVSVMYSGTNPTLGVCPGGGLTLTPNGANVYNYLIDGNIFSGNPLALTTPTGYASGSHTFIVAGQAANGCAAGILSSFSVHAIPVISIVPSPATAICVNKTLTLTASGGATYNWSTATSTLTANPYTVNTGNTPGTKIYTVFGKSVGGCTATATRSLTVNACTGIENVFGDVSAIAAFPNPFTNEVKVTGFNGRIEIYNAIGQIVYASAVAESETINTSDLAKGVYVLKSYDAQGEEVKTIKLVKN